jgi:hypothetical protein
MFGVVYPILSPSLKREGDGMAFKTFIEILPQLSPVLSPSPNGEGDIKSINLCVLCIFARKISGNY